MGGSKSTDQGDDMTTVDQIMKAYTPYAQIPRNEARSVIDALRTIPSFREETWTNSFVNGRYTSPSGRWTAEDESGQVEITWSVNAANGHDNGYLVSRDSWWWSSLRKAAISYVTNSESHNEWLLKKAVEYRSSADRHERESQKYLLEAHRNVFAARNSRRRGIMEDAVAQLKWAARARMEAKYQKERANDDLSYATAYEREIDDERWIVGQVNARIVAGGELLKNWSAPLRTDRNSNPHCRESISGGVLSPIATWERELLMK